MQKLLLGSVALIVMSAPVLAADMPVKAVPLPPAWSWTGCYVGLNVGYGWARFSKSDVVRVSPTPFTFADFDFDDDGAAGGVQTGCNWQNGQWSSGSRPTFRSPASKPGGISTTVLRSIPEPDFDTDVRSSLRYFGTVRGRIGWTVTATALLYVTGGLAYGRVNSSLFFPPATGALTTFGNFDSQTHFGYVVGVGGEAKIAENFTAKLEYLYVDLGSKTYDLSTPVPPSSINTTDGSNGWTSIPCASD